jgi:hypothetical protein
MSAQKELLNRLHIPFDEIIRGLREIGYAIPNDAEYDEYTHKGASKILTIRWRECVPVIPVVVLGAK